MKYIKGNEEGFVSFDRYFEYIESIKNRLGPELYEFASNPSHYDLSSQSSLHDSWLSSLVIGESSEADEIKQRSIDIELVLLGPYHDRKSSLTYTSVKKYSIDYSSGVGSYRSGHGDLLVHEFRIENDQWFCHEIEFDRKTIFQVVCENIEVSCVKVE